MGLFRNSSSAKKPPKKKIADWKSSDMNKWLRFIGQSKYEEAFKSISPKRLLQLTAADLYMMVETKADADTLLEAIQDLRENGGVTACPVASSPATSLREQRTEAQPSTPAAPAFPAATDALLASAAGGLAAPAQPIHLEEPAADEEFASPVLAPIAVHASEDADAPVTPSMSSHAGAGLVPGSTSQENAQILSGWTGGEEVVSELFAYLSTLGVEGAGLVEATASAPIVGHIVGAIWELHELVRKARGDRHNCEQLDLFCQDVMRVLDIAGGHLSEVDGLRLAKLLEHVEAGIELVDACSRSGWLLRMATNDKGAEPFVAIHNAMLKVLQKCETDTLGNGRQLTYGDYRDASRALRRSLKQLGSGALEAGIRQLTASEAAAEEVASLIGVNALAIIQDAQNCRPGLEPETGSSNGESPFTPTYDASKEHSQQAFIQYDKNRSGALEYEELQAVIADLGMLDSIKQTDLDAFVQHQFRQADADGDGKVTLPEFHEYYQSVAVSRARLELRAQLGLPAEKDLRRVFVSFASFGARQALEDMDGAKFSKLCRDCRLLDRRFTPIDVDIVFAKAKVKGHRRITFDQFISALSHIAEKKQCQLGEVATAVLSNNGPAVSGTRADYVKLFDDKSTYTGVYARGGPSSVDKDKSLRALLDRSPADVRGIKLQQERAAAGDPPLTARPSQSPGLMTASSLTSPMSSLSMSGAQTARARVRKSVSGTRSSLGRSPAPPTAESSSGSAGPATVEDLQRVFKAFAMFGTGAMVASPADSRQKVEMDGSHFAKLCRECGLVGGKLTTTAVDIAFSKAKNKGERKIAFKQFETALRLLAEDKGVPLEAIRDTVAASAGPVRNATQAGTCRLHDEKSLWTGVYAAGGPSTVEKDRITLESLTNRESTTSRRPRMTM